MNRRFHALCRGDAAALAVTLQEPGIRAVSECCLLIIAGCGVYGITIGLWRAPLQGLFTAIKFPLLIFLTAGSNAILNGVLAQLLGARLSFRQTLLAILMSFAIAALILGSAAPITLFVLWNTPPLASREAVTGHSVMLLMHVGLIAYAGLVANRRLLALLAAMSGSAKAARRVLASWLAGNLFLGSQLAWVLRPFIGSPQLGVAFFRDDPLRGNFYEAVWRALNRLFF
jgi:hypothetical protein